MFGHYPALPYRELASFMSDLRQHDDADTRALELAILCVSRTEEVLLAKWSEFDRKSGCGRSPASG